MLKKLEDNSVKFSGQGGRYDKESTTHLIWRLKATESGTQGDKYKVLKRHIYLKSSNKMPTWTNGSRNKVNSSYS